MFWSQLRIDLFRTTVVKGASADGADSRSSLEIKRSFFCHVRAMVVL